MNNENPIIIENEDEHLNREMKHQKKPSKISLPVIIVGVIAVLAIAFSLIVFFYPNPKPSTSAGFASSSTKKSSKPSSSTSQSSSSSSSASASTNGTPTQWTDLSLNQQIAILIQEVDANTTHGPDSLIGPNDKFAMTGTLQNGTLLSAFNVSMGQVSIIGNNLTIALGIYEGTITDTLEKVISSFYSDDSSKSLTNKIAMEIVSPSSLSSSNNLINSWAGTYNAQNDNHDILYLNDDGTAKTKSGEAGTYTVSKENNLESTYFLSNNILNIKKVETNVKLSIVWSDGTTNTYYGYTDTSFNNGASSLALTDGIITSSGGIDSAFLAE